MYTSPLPAHLVGILMSYGSSCFELKIVVNDQVLNLLYYMQFVGGEGISSRPSCVEIGPECSAIIHQCTITSKASGRCSILFLK